MNDEEVLMKKFKAGDHESFEELIVKYRRSAVSFAMRYMHDPYLSEDMVQESFAQIYVYRERYREDCSFKTYLFTIVKNKCIDYIRKSHRDRMDGRGLEHIDLTDGQSTEDRILIDEDRSLVRKMIMELKEEYRTAIYLIEYENFSYQEAARIMGKNLAQMKVLVFRARKKLGMLLKREVQ